MTPGSPLPDNPVPVETPPVPRNRWQGRLLTFCFAVFAFEVGLFLVVIPWLDSWTLNYFQGINPNIESIWDEPSFKGLVTGLGFVNIYIALLQVIRLFRRQTPSTN
ncbi:MAG TPA: hypothetical protein VK752_26690 [Bryobacteraceae bacterium]|jgi:hypothetical protein|nr:hypothetical protein [Bryobacteraceae bacterium]